MRPGQGFPSGGRPKDKSRGERLGSCPGLGGGGYGGQQVCFVGSLGDGRTVRQKVLGACQLLLSVSMHACSRATLFCEEGRKAGEDQSRLIQ